MQFYFQFILLEFAYGVSLVSYMISSLCALQIINVYDQQYESAAAFWPHVHSRIIASLLISQLLLMGLLSTKKAANSTPFLVALPILTLSFHKYCKYRFEPAFRKYPLEVNFEVIFGSIGLVLFLLLFIYKLFIMIECNTLPHILIH